NSADPYYDISYGVNSTGYTLTASPQGNQAKDTNCGTFSLNYLGVKSVSGSLSSTPSKCWGQ
ncbi:type IV pilin protein, partial [Acidihalobacter prosperus]